MKTFWNIKWNALPLYENRYIKTKIKQFGHKVRVNFRSLNVPENGVECEYFRIISIDSLIVYENKYYLEVYSDNCAYKTVNTEMVDYLYDSIFESSWFVSNIDVVLQ